MQKIIFGNLVVLTFLLVSTYSASHLQQKCTVKSRSQCGSPIFCDVDSPLPLKVSVTIQITKRISWSGGRSWQFAIENAKGQLVKLDGHCIQGQSQGGEYGPGANLTLMLTCSSLPRQLVEGDKVWMYVFDDLKADYWLMMDIAIPGISSKESSPSTPFQARERSRDIFSRSFLEKLKMWQRKKVWIPEDK